MSRCDELVKTYPALQVCLPDIQRAAEALTATYRSGGCVYVCGNGGSEADSKHIVGELMKGFTLKRPVQLPDDVRESLSPETAAFLDSRLQGALPAHSLSAENALITAVINDISSDMIYAQQIYGYGKPGDAFIGISTSGNAVNVCLAAELSRAMGLRTIALTGRGGGKLAKLCDTAVRVPADETYKVQEYHLPVYHALCEMVEKTMFIGED